MKLSKHIKTEETHTIEIDAATLRRLLIVEYIYKLNGIKLPETDAVEIFIGVPGGGNWSNSTLYVDNDHPIVVRWHTTIEKNDS